MAKMDSILGSLKDRLWVISYCYNGEVVKLTSNIQLICKGVKMLVIPKDKLWILSYCYNIRVAIQMAIFSRRTYM